MATAEKAGKPVCNHFIAGKCTRGDNCRFSHESSVAEGATKKRKRPGAQFRTRKLEEEGEDVAAIVPVKFGEVPLCRGHSEPCVKRKVTNRKSKNFDREYFRCSHSGMSSREQCGYFLWASQLESAVAAGKVKLHTEEFKLKRTRGGKKKKQFQAPESESNGGKSK